jgi:hypothetical protein
LRGYAGLQHRVEIGDGVRDRHERDAGFVRS